MDVLFSVYYTKNRLRKTLKRNEAKSHIIKSASKKAGRVEKIKAMFNTEYMTFIKFECNEDIFFITKVKI